jgi:hemerythrin-like domain-containing protein
MRPTEILMNEHRVIEQVLDCLDAMADACERDGRIAEETARQCIDFFRSFADRCHHGKEENQLFPMMECRGYSPVEGPTAAMRAEHVQGRSLIRAMEEAIPAATRGEEEARSRWTNAAREYSFMLRQHIEKEDHCLFPMADQALHEGDQAELGRRFDRVEHEEIGPDVYERYVRMADALADRFGVKKNRVPAGTKGCGCPGHS